MTDGSEAQPRPRKKTGSLGREQLETALQGALAAGPTALRQQLQYLLALGHTNRPQKRPPRPRPTGTTQARFEALAVTAPHLNQQQIAQLVADIQQIQDLDVRLPLLTRLALHLSPQAYRGLVRDVWQQIDQMHDEAACARTLFQLAPLLTLVNDEPATPSALLQVVAQAQGIRNKEARLRSLIALGPHLPRSMALRTFERVLQEIEQGHNDALAAKALVSVAEYLPDELQERALNSARTIQDPAERAHALTALARHAPAAVRHSLRVDALEAIDTIESEDERAEALIAFAPHLEHASQNQNYPAILEQALTIAIMIGRRHIRAKVLVALAPHLTPDLQGEALAAVHSLASERDRATLLAELAPTLPPDMLVASLAVAHTMREQDTRVHALAVLSHHVPANARGQTLLDALAAASNLPHHYERVTALVSLVDILPLHLLEQALTNGLETTRLIDNENARGRALTLLGPHLSGALLLRALDIARTLEDPQQRLNAMLGLMPNLSDEHQRENVFEMFGAARQMPLEYKRARALINIAPHLPLEMLSEVEKLAEQFEDPVDRLNVLLAVVQHLPPGQRMSVMGRAWTLLKRIDDGYDRASVLAALAPFLPDSARADLNQAILTTIGSVEDDYDRASAVTLLAPLLADGDNATFAHLPDSYTAVQRGLDCAFKVAQPGERVALLSEGARLWEGIQDHDRTEELWRHSVQRLSAFTLPEILQALGALSPLIRELAGEKGLQDVAYILGLR